MTKVKDLRQILDMQRGLDIQRSVSYDGSESSSSSGSAGEKVPYSDKTNRLQILGGIVPRRNAAPVLSPNTVENLKNISLAAADPKSGIWDSWSSSDFSDRMNSKSRNADPFVPTGNPLLDLHNFTEIRKLPEPAYMVVTRKAKAKRPMLYDCKVDVRN